MPDIPGIRKIGIINYENNRPKVIYNRFVKRFTVFLNKVVFENSRLIVDIHIPV